ncbi:MAG: hypothetical protein LBB82_07645, partial [Treponema sp.]|jgi:hypothetical protein|nr:hypothetical protein [Treponema sp.]
MRAIHIANEKKRDSEVGFEALTRKETVIMVLPDGRERTNIKFIKSMANIEALTAENGSLVKVGEALIAGDSEIDMEKTGKFVQHTHRLWMTEDNKVAYRVNFVEVKYNPDGSEKERVELKRTGANIKADDPVKWTGKTESKADAIRKYVFSKSYQIRHTSGLTYDFLYDMARQLDEQKVLMRVGGGPKGADKLRLSDGGEEYFGFLEGRVEGDKYALILHLTFMPLKALPKDQGAEGGAA